MFDNSSILVTGGTGSFGKRFIQRVLEKYKPRRLIVYSRDEYKQFVMQQTYNAPCMRYFIGDVRDRLRLEMAMRDVDYVVHAAAIKQVPTAEYNPMECINTNVNGADNVVQSCIRTGVKQIIALSTDKAASPINLYGASKLASDKIFIAGNNLSGAGGPRFSVVRYGNVVGSRGSVVPFFDNMIKKGAKSLPITDNRMTRFWITLDQGVDFVLTSFDIMQGGEIFVPKIPSMKVVDLAECMAPGIKQEEIGIRPGEKLHEAMITEDDARSTVDMGDRYVIEPQFASWPRDRTVFEKAKPVAEGFRYTSDVNEDWVDGERLKQMLAESGF